MGMSRDELADLVYDELPGDLPSKAASRRVVKEVFEKIAAAMERGHEVAIPGFGKFSTKTRNARVGRNPQTGEDIDIPEKTVPAFKALGALKTRVDG